MWVVIEVLVIASGSAPGRPIWILLHLGYFWGTAYWEVAILGSALACVDGRPQAPGRVLRDHRLVARFLLLKLVLIPVALVATAFLVVPGLLAMARLGLSLFFVVDQDRGPWAALAASRHATRGSTAQLLRLLLMLLLLNAVGAAILGLGLVITVPMTALAGAYVFRAVTSVR